MFGKTRCPKCGTYARHQRDTEREDQWKSGAFAEYAKIVEKTGAPYGSPANEQYHICNNCGYSFEEKYAQEMFKCAKKFGEEKALRIHRGEE